jgi:hypothetical protein
MARILMDLETSKDFSTDGTDFIDWCGFKGKSECKGLHGTGCNAA